MNHSNPYAGLNFNLRSRRIPWRVAPLAVAFVAFTLMWWVIPDAAFYWLFLPILLILVWMASYGWRPAVTNLVKLLQFIEQM